MKLERVAIAVLLVIVAGQAIAGCADRRRRRAERIAAANTLADAARQEDWLRGQLRVAVRYVHQGQVQLDATQRERNQQALLATTLRLEARELHGDVAVQPQILGDSLKVRSEWGNLDTNGVHVAAQLAVSGVAPIAGRPIAGTMFFDVTLAPVALQLGFACVGPNARFYATGPRYQPLVLERGVVDPKICNPPPPSYQLLSLRVPSLPWAVILFGGGLLAGVAIIR